MQIAVGSTNPVKTHAVRDAFAQNFPGRPIDVSGFDVQSGVRDQPWGDQETRTGALNRAIAAAASFLAAHGRQPDFAVGLEGGVMEDDLASQHAHIAGLGSQVQCFAWMAVLRCEPEATDLQKWGVARTASFELPPKVVALMRGHAGRPPLELGDADDAVFSDVNSKQKGGTVAKVTKGLVDRTLYYVHALHLALVPFLHDETSVYAPV